MPIELHWISPTSPASSPPNPSPSKIARLHLRRPEARNAINFDAISAFERHLSTLESTPDLAAVVFSTDGDASFIAGGDLKAFHTIQRPEEVLDMSVRMKNLFARFEALPAPIIAAIDGHAFGGGGEFLLACDIRIIHHRSTIAFSQLRFALSPGWGGAARLVQHVGRQRALHLLLSMSAISAEQALSWGLVERISDGPALDAALDFAHHIAAQSLNAVQHLKRALRSPDNEQEVFLKLWEAPEHQAAVSAFLSRGRGG